MVFVCHVSILLKKWKIFATVHCSSRLIVENRCVRSLLWKVLMIVLWFWLVLTIHLGGFVVLDFAKK